MIPLAISIFLLASTLALITLLLLMKTTELADAVSRNTAAVNGLASSVDAAVAVLINVEAVTPDADIVPLIAVIDNNTSAATNAKAKLDAALTPPNDLNLFSGNRRVGRSRWATLPSTVHQSLNVLANPASGSLPLECFVPMSGQTPLSS